MGTVAIESPRVQVTLTKTIARDPAGLSKRYAGDKRVFDLTPYLSEHGVVRTSKALGQPAGGFTLVFPDQPDAAMGDSLYGLVEPMDVVEIRMGRVAGELPIVMRGFVVKVARSESLTPDGDPQRVVVIQGNDYGAVLQWCNIVWNKEYMELLTSPSGSGLDMFLSSFKLAELLNLDVIPVNTKASEAVSLVIDTLCNNWLKHLDAIHEKNAVQVLGLDTAGVIEGAISSGLIGPFEGEVWAFLASFADLDWNEAFIEDRADGPWFVYRPKPWRKANDPTTYILPGAKDPGTVEVPAVDLRASNLAHSAEQVANYYWLNTAINLFTPEQMSNSQVFRASAIHETPNTSSTLYGLRKREVMTTQDKWVGVIPSEKNANDRSRYDTYYGEWMDIRQKEIKDLHEDNVVFEEGQLALKGNAALGIGKYVHLTRGSFAAEYYIVGVDHTFTPFRDWLTTVNVQRGTGFLERMKSPGAPIWREGRPGAY